MLVGIGYDLHRLVPGRPLMIGGVAIPAAWGEEGYSDGDVLIHAIIDAILGAAGLGDIGTHFPSSDPKYKGLSSRVMLTNIVSLIRNAGYSVVNLDSTVILQAPKILPFIENIRQTLSQDLDLPYSRVSVKGKTKENVDAVGEGRAIEAFAVVLLESGRNES
ncbi:MAG: 2-C-methyl-D-erythritol 2,4-cyclodiphosphate synthase [Spirochaetota bacterium]